MYKDYISREVSIGCDSCSLFGLLTHISCVYLKGLTEEMVNWLEYWECPLVEPVKIAETPENRTLQLLIKKELYLINPASVLP